MAKYSMTVEDRKKINRILSDANHAAKHDRCPLCGEVQTSFCNSHTVPRFVLENIADNGHVFQSSVAVGLEDLFKASDGVRGTGTMQFICRKCDSYLFSDYESENALRYQPTNKMMAEIAIKNDLLLLSKRYREVELYRLLQEEFNSFENKDVLDTIHRQDIRDYSFSLRRAKKIVEKNLKSGYHLVYWTMLPYTTPIATQSGIALPYDLAGKVVNDVFDDSDSIRMQDMHIFIFPLKDSTSVGVFYHKDDRVYVNFERQFLRLSENDKLKWINYAIFRYTEHYFYAKSLYDEMSNNEKLRILCEDVHGYPNLGHVSLETIISDNIPEVNMDDIPNFLHADYSLQSPTLT